MDPLYLTQMVFACLLAFCSCLGNTAACIALKLSPVPKCPYFINLMFLELVASIFGPVAYLVAVFVDSGWFKEGTSTCTGVIVLQKFSLIGSLLSLTFLAWSHCHKRELPQTKKVLVFSILSTWFLPAIILLCAFLLVQKSHFLDIPWFMCSTTTSIQEYSLLGIVIIVIAIFVHFFSLWLAFSSIMSKNTYYMQDQWNRHRREITVNDPECSTFHMSYSETTSISLDKVFNVLPNKKTSVGQTSVFNANRNWVLNPHHPEIPKAEEGKTERPPKNSDSNDVFYDNDKIEIPKVSVEDGAEETNRRSTACENVFTDPATTEIPFPNTNSRVNLPAMSHCPSASSSSSNSPTKFPTSRQTPSSAGIHYSYSPVLNTSPWYYTTSPSPHLAALGFGDIRKYKRAKFISPTILDFAKIDRTINELKKLVLIVTCLSMIGWLLFAIVFILRAVGLGLPEEVLRLSTMVLFVKSAMTPVLYGVCFLRRRLPCKRYIKCKLPLIHARKECFYNLNDATVTGAYVAKDDSGVELEKYSVFPH